MALPDHMAGQTLQPLDLLDLCLVYPRHPPKQAWDGVRRSVQKLADSNNTALVHGSHSQSSNHDSKLNTMISCRHICALQD